MVNLELAKLYDDIITRALIPSEQRWRIDGNGNRVVLPNEKVYIVCPGDKFCKSTNIFNTAFTWNPKVAYPDVEDVNL
jgi:hypothetical protein